MIVAMWSGPRNLSTALMYSFANRADFAVVDEPFYAHYLRETGLEHPMREAVLASQPQEAEDVIQSLTQLKSQHFYQKHMCQHMLPSVPRDWMFEVQNVFLIRHPARVIASFGAKYESFGLADIGFSQQLELFEMLRAQGHSPLVIDSADIRKAPKAMLTKLCAALEVPFDPAMLAWPAGGHASDGVWAAHWYNAVHASTGFAGPEGPLPALETHAQQELLEQALPIYQRLAAQKLAL
ncbi:HAD family hydrolase [uncultured Lentibacter sp.]|uniref:sulfotransferase-like domain-containing protein n=1 Tax=uncultured Lentibacter sp. TaxID=1659309 RepID=UPI0026216DCF|nr:HAD family hydrolase [uncultured Lentibacter sp.]MCW1955891.1 HAD family hydrolase [Roseobacter sp.]